MNKPAIIRVKPIGFQWEMESPFLFCAHHKDLYPAGNSEMGVDPVLLRGRNIGTDFELRDGFRMYHGSTVPGFPCHPHRGFETVTVVTEGYVDHSDSRGMAGRYGEGDVQWLTTGSGCQHSEMFPLLYDDKPNHAELLQIWLNLPAKDKFTDPEFKMLWSEEIPELTIGMEGAVSRVRIISGTFSGVNGLEPCPASWASDKDNNVGIFLISMEANAQFTIPAISETLVRNLYFYEGSTLTIENSEIAVSNRIKLEGNGAITVINGAAPSKLVLLEGEPIREPVFQYGPFVMNSDIEIRQAIRDYQETEFGGWPWKRRDNVHERNAGRFAKYADGRIERR